MTHVRHWDTLALIANSTHGDISENETQMAIDGINIVLDDSSSMDIDRYNTCQIILDRSLVIDRSIQIGYQLRLVQNMLNTPTDLDSIMDQLKTAYLMIHLYLFKSKMVRDIQVKDILDFEKCDSHYEIVCQLQILTLKTAVECLKYQKDFGLSQKDFCSLFQSGGNFDYNILQTNRSLLTEVVKCFIQLSPLTKTGHKLTYLILALKYSIHACGEDIDHRLEDKIIADCTKMLQKSQTVVYKLTSSPLYEVLQLLKSRNFNLGKYSSIVNIFENISTSLNDSIDWSLFQSKVPIDFHDQKELSTTFNKLKKCDFTSSNDRIFINDLIESIQSFALFNDDCTKVFGFLDFIMINLKKTETMHFDFTFRACSLLTSIFTAKLDLKRLNNVSTLSFFLGNKSAEENDRSLKFFKLTANIEITILRELSSPEQKNKLINKMNQIGYILINSKLFDSALPFLMKSLEVWYEYLEDRINLIQLDNLMKNQMVNTLKLIIKCLTPDPQFQLMIENFKYPDLCVSTLISIIDIVTSSPINSKQTLISKCIITMKNCFSDNGLFLFFLSKIFLVIEFNVNFKSEEEFEFESNSVAYPMRHLIMCHLNSLNISLNPTSDQDLIISLKKIKNHMFEWFKLKPENNSVTEYEFSVLETVCETFTYHDLHLWSIEILEIYLKNFKLNDIQLSIKLRLMLGNLYLNSHQLEKFESLSIETDVLTASPHIKMKHMILSLEYNISANTSNMVNDLNEIYKVLSKDENFQVSIQRDKYLVIELLFILAKFSQIVAKYHRFVTNNIVECVMNLKKEIKILQSIMKNFILSDIGLSMNFKNSIKLKFSQNIINSFSFISDTFFSMGSCKEFEYYAKELETFISNQPSTILKFKYNLEFTKHQLISGKDDNKIDKLFTYIIEYPHDLEDLIDDYFKLSILSTLEQYYSYKEQFKRASQSALKFDNLISKILKSKKSNQSKCLIDLWAQHIGRRGDNKYYDSTIWQSCLFNSGNEYAVTLSLYDQCTRMMEAGPVDNDVCQVLIECAEKYSNCIQKNLNKLPVDLLKSDLNKLINCYTRLISFKNANDLLIINDNFKYLPFLYEKQLATYKLSNNEVLPPKESIQSNSIALDTPDVMAVLSGVLPKNWSFITMDYNSVSNSLFFAKYQHGFKDPLFVEVSLNGKPEFNSTLKKLKEIIQQSDYTTSIEVTSKVATKSEKIEWWDKRKSLDFELKKLLSDIEDSWLGGYSSLFNNEDTNQEDLNHLKLFIRRCLTGRIEKQVLDNINGYYYDLLLKITNVTSQKVKDILEMMFPGVDVEQLSKDLVPLLKRSTLSNTRDTHMFIIPGPESVLIPWESLPSLRGQSVSRFPTIRHLCDRLSDESLIQKGISSENGYYIINPGGDLKRTERQLGTKFKELTTWEGSIGARPLDENEIVSKLNKSNLYIYAGHGGGEQYIKSSTIRKQDKLPPTLLFGCSSGKLKNELFPHGTPYNYLMGGCPSLLVNLWDVTDKDTDLFTMKVLQQWGLLEEEEEIKESGFNMEEFMMTFASDKPNTETLSSCIAKGRDVCKLKYLNGASPVLYGLPLKLC